MTNKLNLGQTVSLLKGVTDVHILCHDYPDGDTLGSAVGLYFILEQLGARSKIVCNKEIPDKFLDMFNGTKTTEFEPKYVISLDIADEKLFGSELSKYVGKVDLCIDHHMSNTGYAKNSLIEGTAATAEIITMLARELKVEVTTLMADALFTGITTDTGCFKYSNVTPQTHELAAYLIEQGAKAADINCVMFDTKSRARIDAEQIIMANMKYYFNNRCAITYITKAELKRICATEDDLDGLAALPRQIEGVKVGVYIRERESNKDFNTYKISLRTQGEVDASKICAKFSGGGHKCAAGCEIKGSLEEIIGIITNEIEPQVI